MSLPRILAAASAFLFVGLNAYMLADLPGTAHLINSGHAMLIGFVSFYLFFLAVAIERWKRKDPMFH